MNDLLLCIQKADFEPHAPPYGDFLVIIEVSDALHRRLSALGATVKYLHGCRVYSWGMPNSACSVSGHGVVDNNYVIGPCEIDRTPREITLGPCVALSISEEVEVVTDNFGSQAVYYSENLVTNRLQLAAMASDGLDLHSMLAVMHSNNMFCQQLNTFSTAVAGVKLSWPGDRFRVGRSVSVIRNSHLDLDYSEAIDVDQYWSLIEAGASEIANNVSAILDSGCDTVCDITGGQDSRMVFAALVALGRVGDVRFHTKDLSNTYVDMVRTSSAEKSYALASADVDIATSLVGSNGGRFMAPGTDTRYKTYTYTNFAKNMMQRRSQVFGSYHFITEAALRTSWSLLERPVVRMMGGGGETYRNYYQILFGVKDDSPKYDESAMRSALRRSRNPAIDYGEDWNEIENRYIDTFNDLPGQSVHQKIDNHYFFFRNRFHFGLTQSVPSNSMSINPALSLHLLKAARLLPQEEKATGRVLFDVTKVLSEKTAYHKYDKFDFDPLKQSVYHRRSRYDSEGPPSAPRRDLLAPDTSGLGRSIRTSHPNWPSVDLVSYAKAANSALIFSLSTGHRQAVGRYLSRALTDQFFETGYSLPTRVLSWHSRIQSFFDFAGEAQ